MKKLQLHKGIKYSICSCGLSKFLPFCDNAHREHNEKNGSNYKSIKIIAEETVNIDINSSTWLLLNIILLSTGTEIMNI